MIDTMTHVPGQSSLRGTKRAQTDALEPQLSDVRRHRVSPRKVDSAAPEVSSANGAEDPASPASGQPLEDFSKGGVPRRSQSVIGGQCADEAWVRASRADDPTRRPGICHLRQRYSHLCQGADTATATQDGRGFVPAANTRTRAACDAGERNRMPEPDGNQQCRPRDHARSEPIDD